MVASVKEFFTKYVEFSGRTSRKTYWLTILGLFILSFLIGFVGGIIGFAIGADNNTTSFVISAICALAIILPSIAMDIRRMHDINKSGWWILISLVPIVGGIIFLVFTLLPSVNEGNKY